MGLKKMFKTREGFNSFMKIFKFIPDKLYLKTIYRLRFKKKLNLKDPKTFNEKMQWLKLYNRNELFTRMVDKYESKQIVKDIIGEEYNVKTLGVWDKFEDIDFNSLPDKFVLKCTHDSGGLVICRDKSKLDLKAAKKKIKKSLKCNFYYVCREWPYKNVKPRIICEEYLENDGNVNLDVYKFFTFNGEAKIIQMIQNDKTNYETIDYFDTDWKLLPFIQNHPNSEKTLEKPKQLSDMLNLVNKLSSYFNIPFLRIDIYIHKNKLYFSEFTFFSDAGFAKFNPEEYDTKLGEMIKIK